MDWWNTLTEPQACYCWNLTLGWYNYREIAPHIIGNKLSDVGRASKEARELMESTKSDLGAFKDSINFELEELKKSFSQVRYDVGEARNDIAEAGIKNEAATKGCSEGNKN